MELRKLKVGQTYTILHRGSELQATCADTGFDKAGKRLRFPMAAKFILSNGGAVYVPARDITPAKEANQ